MYDVYEHDKRVFNHVESRKVSRKNQIRKIKQTCKSDLSFNLLIRTKRGAIDQLPKPGGDLH